MTDVLSFEVRVLPFLPNGQTNGPRFVNLFDTDLSTAALNNSNKNYPNGASTTARIFDTWSNMQEKPQAAPTTTPTFDYSAYATVGQSQTIPFPTSVRIMAIQVIIRVWDVKTEQTRQITIAQDL